MAYTFYSRCWNCDETHVCRDYDEACAWDERHEEQHPSHRTEIDDVPDEDDS